MTCKAMPAKKRPNNKLSPPPEHRRTVYTKNIVENEFSGTVILFDLTNSTEMKMDKQFPDWVDEIREFYENIHFITNSEKAFGWEKFLGDAFMFFVSPESRLEQFGIRNLKPQEIVDVCEEVMNHFYDTYSHYRKDKVKGQPPHKSLRQITCAIDCGPNIINFKELVDDTVSEFDPVGKPIDRCFRVSGLCGPGQLLISRHMYEMLPKPYQEKFHKMNIPKGQLKGLHNENPPEDHVYYLIPKDEIIENLLSLEYVELVEEAKAMTSKAKIKLLREKTNNQESEIERLKSMLETAKKKGKRK